MQEPTTKQELLAILWRMRADLERLVAEAGPLRLEQPGALDDWSIKDVIAHLTGWRWWSVARMEAAATKRPPTPPWSGGLDENDEGATDQINQQFYQANRDRPVAEVLGDSRATFDRLEAAIAALSDAELFEAGRYPWMGQYNNAAIVLGTALHLWEDHYPSLSFFLARASAAS